MGASELSQEYFRANEIAWIGDAMVYRKSATRDAPFQEAPPLGEAEATPMQAMSPPHVKPVKIPVEEIVTLQPVDEDARRLYDSARDHADRGEHEKAEEICTRYLDRVPDSLDGYFLLSVITQAEERNELAVEALRKALFLNHDFVIGHFNLGMLYRKLGRLRFAQRHFMRARQLLLGLPRNEILPHSEGQTAGGILSATDQFLRALGGGGK